jgi:hypothetical protein
MSKRFAIAAAMAIALAVPGAAGAQSNILTDWGVSDMRQALTAAGAKITSETKLDSGAPYINAETDQGLKFVVYGTVCKGETVKRCAGANLVADFTYDSDAAVDAREKKIDRAAVGVRNAGDNTLEASRYLIFDDGITAGNLSKNIAVFIEVVHDIWNGGGD